MPHKNRIAIRSFLAATLGLAAAAAPLARADFDISPGASGGVLNTNAFEDATDTFVSNVRVFHFALGNDGPFFAQDPGFHPRPGGGIPAGQLLSITIGSPLMYWNGAGPVSFGALPNGETLKLQNGTPSLTVGSTAPDGSLNIATTDAFGEFDQHVGSTLVGLGAADPADGMYMTSFILHNPGGALGDSPQFWILYNNNVDDETEIAATLAVRDQLAPGTNVAGVPEPATLSLFAAAGLLVLRRHRRRAEGKDTAA